MPAWIHWILIAIVTCGFALALGCYGWLLGREDMMDDGSAPPIDQ